MWHAWFHMESTLSTMLALLVAVSAIAVVSSESQKVIAVYNSSDEVNQDCIKGAELKYGIADLPSSFSSNTQLRICSNLTLDRNITLSGLSNVAVVGYDNPVLRCLNGSEVGLIFADLHDLQLRNFAVDGCGVMMDIDKDPVHNIKASVFIKTSVNIIIDSVSIMRGPGSGLAMFYNNGSIEVGRCTFEKNGLDRHTGGNGVYLETGPPASNDRMANGLVADYIFTDCVFASNNASTGMDDILKGFTRFDKGGGMCIYVLGSEHINFTIAGSTYFVNNEAEHYGGGLFASYVGKSRNNNILVFDALFAQNSGQYGGGTYSGYIHARTPDGLPLTPLNCSHLYTRASFKGNQAQFGGGSSVFSTKTFTDDSSAQVTFDGCWWLNNVGQYGAAIAVLPNAWNLYDEGYLPTPRFTNCQIEMNMVEPMSIKQKGDYRQDLKGAGAFYCYGHSILFEGVNSFHRNSGTALYLGSCLGIFTANSITAFSDNTGYQGGAIYELSSVIYLHDNASMSFLMNEATDKGGAIYEHTFFMHIYDYSRTCFIDYIDNIKDVAKRNISVTFSYNYAGDRGHSIYASSLRPCYNRFSFSAANLSVDIFDQVGNFTYFPEGRPLEVATAVNHSDFTDETWTGRLEFIPGKESEIPFYDVDDLDHNVTTNYLVTFNTTAVTTSNFYSEISSNHLRLYGAAHASARVTLSDTSSRQIAHEFVVTMQACPPGFIEDKSHSCICSVSTDGSYVGIHSCNLTLMRAYQKRGYWIGYGANETAGEDTLASGYCHQEFCSDGSNRLLPGSANREELNQLVCTESRTGVLCGQCKENFSVHYHTLDAACKADKHCGVGWLLYILSEIVPVTIVFLVIIFFNIPFTSGLFHGFIFYCQVVEALQVTAIGLIPFSKAALALNKLHSLIYLSFSLDMFVLDELSFCLWKGANALSVLAFNYVTFAYALLLILLVTVLMKKCNLSRHFSRFSRCLPLLSKQSSSFQGSIIHGLSAFLILCYARCARTSVNLLTFSTIYNKGWSSAKRVVYFDGEIEWMSLEHMPYAIPALVLLLFIVMLPPTLLLFYPLHYKVLSLLRLSESRCAQVFFSPLEKMKPFFDSFQSCFKDEYRFFSGLYFAYRFFIMFFMLVLYLQARFFVVEIQLVCMLVLHAVCQPYKKRLHNVVDTLLIGNLALVNAITYYNFSTSASEVDDSIISATVWIQTVLILLPLIVILLCLLALAVRLVRRCWMAKQEGSKWERSSSSEPDEFPARLNYGSCDITPMLPDHKN